MRTKVKFDLDGLEDYLKQINDMGKSVEGAVSKALVESARLVRDDIEKWATKHKRSGNTLEGVHMSEPVNESNFIYVDVGISSEKSPQSWRAVFVEYGTPRADSDPGIRNAFDKNRAKIKRIQKEVLKKEGLPFG